jgi:hypothetical protein
MGQHPSLRLYPPELRERAVRMAQELIDKQGGQRVGVVTRVAESWESAASRCVAG